MMEVSSATVSSSSISSSPATTAMINIIDLPTEVLGRIESYLCASDCAQLSGTCVMLKDRWNGNRWEQTFYLHSNSTNNSKRPRALQSAPSFVCLMEEVPEETPTTFNMSSLLPSVFKVYAYLWDTIELAMLGYYGSVADDLEDFTTKPPSYCFSKRSLLRVSSSSRLNISAWKLACILKEKGVQCIQCRICNKIDVLGRSVNPNNRSKTTTSSANTINMPTSATWIRPCLCNELVHRTCLEQKIGLVVDRLYFRTTNRRWITYDDTLNDDNHYTLTGVAAVNEANEFSHNPKAICHKCQTRYSRSVRLPYNAKEVFLASLVDPLSLLRAFSTFIHFLLACFLLSTIEGLFDDTHNDHQQDDCNRNTIVIFHLSPIFLLKWPTRHGFALAWWQLQRCCLLHIFLSPRFAAVVDRLWTHGPIKYFYCRLYLYFIVTSAGLSFSFVPFIQAFPRHIPECDMERAIQQAAFRNRSANGKVQLTHANLSWSLIEKE